MARIASRSPGSASRTSIIQRPRSCSPARHISRPGTGLLAKKRDEHEGASMSVHVNHLGQPIGFPLPDWQARPRPPRDAIEGRFCRLERFDPDRHCPELFDAYAEDRDGRIWTYMAHGPFAGFGEFRDLMQTHFTGADPLCHVIIDRASGRAAGMASYMRIDPAMGSIEVGSIAYSPRLQRSREAIETMYLMMRRAFELGYRRYEWKCDALNAASRAAALRLGLSYEGTFRQASV